MVMRNASLTAMYTKYIHPKIEHFTVLVEAPACDFLVRSARIWEAVNDSDTVLEASNVSIAYADRHLGRLSWVLQQAVRLPVVKVDVLPASAPESPPVASFEWECTSHVPQEMHKFYSSSWSLFWGFS